MSYEQMKLCFSNFIHQLSLMKMSDDTIQVIFGKLLEAARSWCISFRLKIDIDGGRIMRWCSLAFAQRRANEI